MHACHSLMLIQQKPFWGGPSPKVSNQFSLGFTRVGYLGLIRDWFGLGWVHVGLIRLSFWLIQSWVGVDLGLVQG